VVQRDGRLQARHSIRTSGAIESSLARQRNRARALGLSAEELIADVRRESLIVTRRAAT
jgi:hypothetical protein